MQPAFQDMDQFLTGSVDGYPSLASLDAEGAGLRESQDLFELYVSDYVTLARCRVRPELPCLLANFLLEHWSEAQISQAQGVVACISAAGLCGTAGRQQCAARSEELSLGVQMPSTFEAPALALSSSDWPYTGHTGSWMLMLGLLTWQEDLKHLRTLWDMVAVIMGKFDEWQSTLWNDIDVDVLIEATKQLAKDVRTLNKAVRAFEVYK